MADWRVGRPDWRSAPDCRMWGMEGMKLVRWLLRA